MEGRVVLVMAFGRAGGSGVDVAAERIRGIHECFVMFIK